MISVNVLNKLHNRLDYLIYPDNLNQAMNYLIKHKLTIIGIVLGSISGFAYSYFIGCESGSCAITSSPFNSSLYGAVMGGLLFSMFEKS